MNSQEQIAQSINDSSYRNTHAVYLKHANETVKKQVLEFLNSHCQDLVVAQRLTPDKAEKPITNGQFYLTSYKNKCEPGFLVFLPKQYPVFVRFHLSKKEREQTKGQPLCFILQLRVSDMIKEGSVFVVALDTNSHLMIIEDVYVWRKETIFNNEPFSKRRNKLKEFVETHWIPDARLLSGIVTEISQPKPISTFKTLIENKETHRIDFVPETPGKRRFYYILNETQGALNSSDGYYGRVVKVETKLEPKVEPKIEPKIEQKVETPKIKETVLKAVRVPLLPDVYDLFDNDNKNLGRGAIQQLELSKKMKEHNGEMKVRVIFNEEFQRYEIISLI